MVFCACAACLPVRLPKLQIADADRRLGGTVRVKLRAFACAGEGALLAVLVLQVRT